MSGGDIKVGINTPEPEMSTQSPISLEERVASLESNYEDYSGKMKDFNTSFQFNQARMDGFGRELKILLAEINIISEWILDKFGVQLIDKESFLFKHIHDYDEVENICTSLSMRKYFNTKGQSQTTTKAKSGKQQRRHSVEVSEEDVSFDEEEEEQIEEPDDDPGFLSSESEQHDQEEEAEEEEEEGGTGDDAVPEELVETVYKEQESEAEEEAEGSRPRRKSRRKINYKELAAETNDHEVETRGKSKKKVLPTKKGKSSRSKSPAPKKRIRIRIRKPVGEKTVKVKAELKRGPTDPAKVPKRGRPKKPASEKIENWKIKLPVQCDECGRIFKGTGSLRTHKMIHLDVRPFECKECGKAFRRRHHLNFHLMVHAGDKKLQCRFCGKLFHIARDLMRHERTHTGEKPYACHLCPKSFNIKPHLIMHIRTHTGERPYKCNICEKAFSQSNSLRIHKKIHFKVPNTNTSTESKKRPRSTGTSRSPRKPKATGNDVIASKSPAQFSAVVNENIELQHTDSSSTVVSERILPLVIPENLTAQAQALRKPDSTASQGSSNYGDEDPLSSLQQQQQQQPQNFFDPVQQAWRMAISQAQQTQTTSVIMNSRIDNQSTAGQIGQVRNSNDRTLGANTTSAHSSSTTFNIPQFYDPNIRYFGP